MPEIANFVSAGRPLRRFRVSLPGGGTERIVAVEDRKPFTKILRRHVEEVKELADGRKKIVHVLQNVEHPYDVKSEMVADAIRSYNDAAPSMPAKSIKQLQIEDMGPVPVDQVVEAVQNIPAVSAPRSSKSKSISEPLV